MCGCVFVLDARGVAAACPTRQVPASLRGKLARCETVLTCSLVSDSTSSFWLTNTRRSYCDFIVSCSLQSRFCLLELLVCQQFEVCRRRIQFGQFICDKSSQPIKSQTPQTLVSLCRFSLKKQLARARRPLAKQSSRRRRKCREMRNRLKCRCQISFALLLSGALDLNRAMLTCATICWRLS